MCKQEDYFKKLIYMHNKKYTSMSCKHREAQAVQSSGITGPKTAPDPHPAGTGSRPPKPKENIKKKSYPKSCL